MNDRSKLNYVVFLVLSFLIIFLYTTFFSPAPPQKAVEKAAPGGGVSETTQPSEERAEEPVEKKNLPAAPQGRLITIKTPLYTGIIDTAGGRIIEWRLEEYNENTGDNSPPVNLLEDSPPAFNTVLKLDGLPIPDPIPFEFDGGAEVNAYEAEKKITLNWKSPDGIEVRKTLLIDPSAYLIRQRLEVSNNTAGSLKENVAIESYEKIIESSSSFFAPVSDPNSRSFVAMISNEVERMQTPPEEDAMLKGVINWFGFSGKYFMHVLLPEIGGETQIHLEEAEGLFGITFYYPPDIIPAGKTSVYESKLYIGPMDYGFLESAGRGLEKAPDYGWVSFLAKPLLWLLKELNDIFRNYGIAIILITFLIRLVFLPLTLKGMASMKGMQTRMQELKPKIDALKEKYKDDKTKQNQELMRLYTGHGINPLSSLGGCLPLVIQFPVFVALYYVLDYAIELRHSSFLWIDDLSSPENLFDIPGIGIPFRVLPLLMGVSWYFSQKLTPTTAIGTDNMQMKVMEFMPIIFTVMFWGLPSGLILYWTVSNILAIVQQLYVNRRFAASKGGK